MGLPAKAQEALHPKQNQFMRTESCRFGLGALLVGVGLVPGVAPAQDWWFAAGPVFRGGMKTSVDARPSYAQTTPGLLGTPTLGGIGDASAYANRTYDNGYVNIDSGTLGTPAGAQGVTWNWGYNNASQYQPAGAGTLSFFKQGMPASSGSDNMLGTGLQLLAGMHLRQSDQWSVDLTFGFQGTWGADGNLNQSIGGIVDRYNVSAIPPASFPAPGFHGTYAGPFGNPPVLPSPQIPNQPMSRSSATVDTIAYGVDQSLYELSLGPQFSYSPNSWLKLNLRPTMSANILDVDVRRTEVFMLPAALGGGGQSWSNQSGRRNVFLGFGVTGGADLDLGKGFFAGVFGGYEWVMERMNIPVGPNTVSVDASGFVAGAVFGKRF